MVPINETITLRGAGLDPDTSNAARLTYQWRTTPANLGRFGNAAAATTTWTPAGATATAVTLTLRVADRSSNSEATVALRLGLATSTGSDVEPTFGGATIAAQTYTVGARVNLVLPAAAGGNPPLTYAIVETLPGGLNFAADSRVLIGVPNAPQAAADYTYTAADSDADAATLTFTITINAPSGDPLAFDDQAVIDAQTYTAGEPITPLTLPAATGGVGMLNYRVAPALPLGLLFDGATRTLRGTPFTAPFSSRPYTYVVTDSRDRNPTTVSLNFFISVAARTGSDILAEAVISEDAGATEPATGSLTVPDSLSGFVAQTASASRYGRFTIDANGDWRFVLAPDGDANRAAVQGLNPGQTLAAEITVDGRAESGAQGAIGRIRVVIQGALEPVTGPRTAIITENETGASAVEGGQLVLPLAALLGVNPATAWTPATRDGMFGVFTLNADGAWSYALDTNRAATQALTGGVLPVERFEVAPLSPLYEAVTLTATIPGRNDPPVITVARADRTTCAPAGGAVERRRR